MGWRFQKRITILPGIRLNLSRGGISASIGPKGATVTVGKNGVYGNAGIPGSGISYREKIVSWPSRNPTETVSHLPLDLPHEFDESSTSPWGPPSKPKRKTNPWLFVIALAIVIGIVVLI